MISSKAISLEDIAAEAGVSVSLVSRVLTGKIKGQRRDAAERAARVQRIVDRLGYRPQSSARAMRSRQSYQVGVLMFDLERLMWTPGAPEILRGIDDVFKSAGYVISILRADDLVGGDVFESRAFRERMLDGMLVVGHHDSRVRKQIQSVFPKCVWVDSSIWRPTCCVRRDEKQAGYQAAELLLKAGFKNLLWFGHEPDSTSHYSLSERYAGVRAAVLKYEATLEMAPADLVQTRRPVNRIKLLEQCMRKDLGVVIYDIRLAQIWLSSARGTHVMPGTDITCVCCDGTLETEITWSDLSRVVFDRYTMGRLSAEMLLAQITGENTSPKSILLPSAPVANI